MSMRMLIDARHREETRVAVVKGNRVEEFDFESEEHKQLKGNIYLAKVTRVEPSLQAAFIDYGGNRHGFLAFSEIHPDYYQIPKEDREALLREEAEHAAEEEALRAREDEADGDAHDDDVDAIERLDDDGGPEELDAAEEYDEDGEEGDAPAPRPQAAGSEDSAAADVLRQKRMNLRRRYKIQDVIRRRQVLLVQVVKEERGNKGAALTTYLSLAGRYCVLMPNTSHGGGISRKISNAADRKRLKSIMSDLNLPKSMGCIVRTAGLQRTSQEIRRDFDYLARLWDEIREKTLGSSAPSEVYRDSDLIKRAIRDIYSKDIDEVIVEGEEGYHHARSFMKLLMPTHARKIAPYSDAVPLFQRHGVEDQLGAMYQPVVQLKSGGYLVINPTEALVSIDINSGRSTREHNVEQTALNTNLEAAHEIARQLRLRDMAGLIVIDFIDMEVGSNNRKVEKAIKEALKNDRARIQVGRISSFGLFEMSRQRLRTGVLEASTRICPHCEGSGFIRTASSSGLSALRMLEEEAARGRGSQLRLRASQEAALYVLNRKRAELADIEDRYGVEIEIASDGTPEGARMTVETGGPPPSHAPKLPAPVQREADDDLPEELDEDEGFAGEAAQGGDSEGGEGRRRRRRRRRGGRRDEAGYGVEGDGDAGDAVTEAAVDAGDDEGEPVTAATEGGDEAEDGQERRGRGRRGRRGGRRGRREGGDAVATTDPVQDEDVVAAEAASYGVETLVPPADQAGTAPDVADAAAEALAPGIELEPAPKPRRRPRARKADPAAAPAVEETATGMPTGADPLPLADTAPLADAMLPADAPEPAPKPRRGRAKAAPVEAASGEAEGGTAPAKPRRTRRKAAADEPATPLVATADAATLTAPVEEAAPAEPAPTAPDAPASSEDADAPPAPRRGWWQRTFG